MSLNIKSKQTHQLVHELASLTGETQTSAVTNAVQEKLTRLRQRTRGGTVEQLLDLGRDVASRLQEPERSVPHGDLLYDEKGLPG